MSPIDLVLKINHPLLQKKIIFFTVFLFISSMVHAEILCSFRINSLPTLKQYCAESRSSLTGCCLSSTISKYITNISTELFNQDLAVFGTFVSVPEKLESHFILFFPIDNPHKLPPLPQNFFSETIDNYLAVSLSKEALLQTSKSIIEIKDHLRKSHSPFSLFCNVKKTWNNFRATAQLIRGICLMTQSSEPELQKLDFQLSEFGFFLLDSLNELTVTLEKNSDSKGQTLHCSLAFSEESPFNTLFSPQATEKYPDPNFPSENTLFHIAFAPLNVRDSALKILSLLENRMGFKPDDISKMKQNLDDYLGVDPSPGLFILDCMNLSKDLQAPCIRIRKENMSLNLKMLSQKLTIIDKSLPFKLTSKISKPSSFPESLSAEIRMPPPSTNRNDLPSIFPLIFNYLTPVDSLLNFTFIEKGNTLWGIPGKEPVQDLNFSPIQEQNVDVLPFLMLKLRFSDLLELYQKCFETDSSLRPPSPKMDKLELIFSIYYNKDELNISLTFPNTL